jgi:ferredoxin
MAAMSSEPADGHILRIAVDRDRCEGHGLCEQASPEVFELDDDGILEHHFAGRDIPVELQSRASAAVVACPVAALRIEQSATPGAAPSEPMSKRL